LKLGSESEKSIRLILLRIHLAIKELQQTQGHVIHLFVVDGWVHDDGVDVSRGSSKRRSRRVATAVARGAATAAATTATTVAVTILGAGSEETLHSTGRHRRSFSLKKQNKTIWRLKIGKDKQKSVHLISSRDIEMGLLKAASNQHIARHTHSLFSHCSRRLAPGEITPNHQKKKGGASIREAQILYNIQPNYQQDLALNTHTQLQILYKPLRWVRLGPSSPPFDVALYSSSSVFVFFLNFSPGPTYIDRYFGWPIASQVTQQEEKRLCDL
jgi:hypothetical protein